jgi:hypothetical protein
MRSKNLKMMVKMNRKMKKIKENKRSEKGRSKKMRK